MKDRFGELLGQRLLYVLVPPELETAARKSWSPRSQATTTDSAMNPFTGWQVTTDARTGRYQALLLFLRIPAIAPVFIRATLAGFETPTVQSQVDFMTDNIAVKCNHNFGFGVADYVGGSTNAGA